MAGLQKSKSRKKSKFRQRPLSPIKEEIAKLKPEDIQALIQDLRIHQVELDTQIEELKRTQEELQQSRDRYQDLYNTVPVGYFTIDSKYAILEANATAANLLDIPHSVLLRSKFTDHVAPTQKSQDTFYLCIRKIRQTSCQQECEFEMQQRDGSRFPAQLKSGAIGTAADKNQFRIAISDITEMKKQEQAIKESEKRYRSLFENMLDGYAYCQGIFQNDHMQDFIYLEVNEAFKKLTGLRNVIGRKVTKVIPGIKESNPQLFEIYERAALTGQSERFEVYLDQLKIWFSISVYSLEKGTFTAVFENITRRKQAEETLAKHREELKKTVKERTFQLAESEEKYRRLVENAGEAVIVLQGDRMRFFNRQTLEISGYSTQEIAAKSITEFIYPDDRQMVNDIYLKRLQGEKVPSSYEFRMLRKDGSVSWARINSVLISWEGKPATLALVTDINERKQAEEALIKSRNDLARANEQLKQYGHRITQVQEEERKRIAYELHDDTAQYLSILKLEIEDLLHSGKIQSPELRNKLEFLRTDAERAFNDVRRYSHELRPGVLEHLGLLAALEQIAEDINKLKQVKVELHSEGTEPKLSEEIKLAFFRIVQEALNNVRKHSQASKANVVVQFEKKHIYMAVTDNGIGFDPGDAATRSRLKGSLGMMSMRERADLIGAKLKIDSKPNKGTTIKIERDL